MDWSSDRGIGLGSVMQMARSFYPAQLLLNAVKLDVFSALGDGRATGTELRERLDLHPRGAQDFFDSLVSIGLLERTAEFYTNSTVAGRHLDRNRPETYMGDYLELSNEIYPLWANLSETLRTGRPQVNEGHIFEIYDGPIEGQRAFLRAMATITKMSAPEVPQAIDFSRYRSFADIGGSTGTLAGEIVKAHPHLSAVNFDLALVEPHFRENVEQLGVSDAVTFQVGDFFADPLPEADLLIFAHILHDWDVEERKTLLRKAYEALPPGGSVLILETMIDDERQNAAALMLSLSMLLFSPGGNEYTYGELVGWLAEAGFRDPAAHVIANGFETVAIAHKPA